MTTSEFILRVASNMLSFRSVARSAPRTFSRLTSASFRQSAIRQRPSTFAKLSQGTILRPLQASAFSTSGFRRAANGETDEELSAKLESELQFEEEASQEEQLPASITDFLQNSLFEIEDIPGKEDVKLTRTFGDEK
jgi:complement component 1 Q subcomponent-binding protein, mitochondrial